MEAVEQAANKREDVEQCAERSEDAGGHCEVKRTPERGATLTVMILFPQSAL